MSISKMGSPNCCCRSFINRSITYLSLVIVIWTTFSSIASAFRPKVESNSQLSSFESYRRSSSSSSSSSPLLSSSSSSAYYSPSIYPIVSYVSSPVDDYEGSASFNSRSRAIMTTGQLISSPSIMSSIVSSAQVPFVFGRKKGGKRGPSIVRNKPVYPAPIGPIEDDRIVEDDKRYPIPLTSSSQKSQSTSPSDSGIDWSSADMMQHPIDEEARKSNRSLGQPCSYSSDCGSGCCLLDRTSKIRSCQPLALLHEKCTNSQVKGDLYVDACPCASGSQFCTINKRCSW